MKFLEPERRWYQFSLRALLLLSTVFAALCSIGVTTHWSVSGAITASLLIGGICGGLVGGTRGGIVAGALFAAPVLVLAIVLIAAVMFPASGLWSRQTWQFACGIAVLIGGVSAGII